MENTFRRPEGDIRTEFCGPCYEFLSTNPIAQRLSMVTRLEDLPEEWSGKRSLHCAQNRPRSLRREDICLFCRIVPVTWEVIDISYQIAVRQQSIHLRSITISEGIRISENQWYRSIERPNDILFYVCAYTRAPTASVVQMKPILENLWSAEDVQASRSWLDACLSTHWCPKTTIPLLPTRVLDVSVENPHGTSDELDKIRLHHSSINETAPYAALSYCWGGPQSLTLNAGTLEDLTHGVPISRLPKTIVDAICVTRGLGLKYLWIDSLCIMQDSINDKTQEIRHMGNIYQHAHVTIAAANASTVEHGFLKANLDMFFHQRWRRIPFGRLGEAYVAGADSMSYDTQLEPLAQRGWSYQEDLLSQRMLIFDTLGLRWRCTSQADTHHQGLRPYAGLGTIDYIFNNALRRREINPNTNEALLDRWVGIVETYSGRQLSLDSDKLPALSAIAAIYSPFGGRYFAGLWEVMLQPCLLWRIDPDTIETSILPWAKPTVAKYRAPSWSWASTNERVRLSSRFLRPGYYVLKILACEVTLADKESPFGEVTAATLTVAGLLLQCKDNSWLSQYPTRGLPRGVYIDRHGQYNPSPNSVHFLRIWQQEASENGGKYTDGPSAGIILYGTLKDQFVRIGFFDERSTLPVGDIEDTTETVLTIR